MNRRLAVLAFACSLVLSGCLGGSATAPDSTTVPDATATTVPDATATTTAATVTETTATTATTTATSPRHRTYDTREALADDAPFSVPEPNVSEPFAFESALLMELSDSEAVAMAYHHVENGTLENVVSVRKAENESAYNLTAGNATEVGDRDARYVEEDGGGKLVWECDSYVYRVSVETFTDEFGERELREVAESVGCE